MSDAVPAPAADRMGGMLDAIGGAERRRSIAKNLRRLWQQLGPTRLAATLAFLVIAVLLARLSWQLPLAADAERALYDMRAVVTAPRVEQDQRILLVTYTDETLFRTGNRSPVDRSILTRALANLDAMGAKSIGIDIGFDMAQDDDEPLKAQLRAMKTPTWLAYVEQASNPHTIIYEQEQFLKGFIASVRTPVTRPTHVRLIADDDGVVRRWPSRPPGLPPMMANALAGPNPAFDNYQGGIRYRLPLRVEGNAADEVFSKIEIDNFGTEMDDDVRAALAEGVRGRHVIIGGDIVDNDMFNTPLSRIPDFASKERKMMIGMEVHATMLAQQLDGAVLNPLSGRSLWLLALLVVIAGGLTSLIETRARYVALLLIGQLGAFFLFPFWLQSRGVDTLTLPAFGWALGWILGYVAVGTASRTIGAHQRAFAQSALGKYLPRDIATEIMRDPDKLALHGEKREIFCVFTDLEGFTKLSHAVTPETVARLLNDYLDRLSEVVLGHGGTIDKFVGDAVVAFWGAPVSRPDDADRAASAARYMYEAGEAFRREMAEGVPPLGMTRVGLHVGDAIVGNFGGEGRIQYTALGDSMNTAARLESANKEMKTRVLASREAVSRSNRDDYVPMGRVTLRGRAQPVDVYEPRPDMSAEDRAEIAALVAAHADGKKDDYVMHATAVHAKFSHEPCILFLLERLEQTEGGESYVLS